MTFEVTCLCKEHRHANVGTCRLHALDESVGRPACRGDVIDHQDALTTEEILVDVVALVCPVCEFMHMADMSLLTMAADDDMTEPVHGSEPLRKFLREPETVVTQFAGDFTIFTDNSVFLVIPAIIMQNE